MILKILNTLLCEATETEKSPESWKIYDNLSEVTYCQELHPNNSWEEEIKPDVVVPYAEGMSISDRPIVIVTATDKDGGTLVFWIGTRAYLCNDSGKTIEKLVP